MIKSDVTQGTTYAILAAVGDYTGMNIANLPTHQADLSFIKSSLVQGLMVDPDNICVLGSRGTVSAKELAIALKNFSGLLTENDTLIFYFSGHGRKNELVFSDITLRLNSVLDYFNSLKCKNSLIILDCCFAGDFEMNGPRQMMLEDTISAFTGKGIAIMASSSADGVSRLGIGRKSSLYTEIVGSAMMSKRRMRKGYISLDDINDDVFFMMEMWNKQNPDKTQNPIFRSNLVGTLYFRVSDETPYTQKEIQYKEASYTVYGAKPLSTNKYKRFCVFIIFDNDDPYRKLPEITQEVVEKLKNEKVFSSERSEKKFGNKSAHAIWCYFGKDEDDMIQHTHYAYTIWAANDELKKLYFRENKSSEITDGIYIYKNSSYEMLKKMQEPTISREEFVQQNKMFLSEIVNMAELFICDLREIPNKTLAVADVQNKYQEWSLKVRRKYIALSEMDSAPSDLYEWSNEITNLAGCIVDLSLLLEENIGEREMWLINNSIRLYNESLIRLKELEKQL